MGSPRGEREREQQSKANEEIRRRRERNAFSLFLLCDSVFLYLKEERKESSFLSFSANEGSLLIRVDVEPSYSLRVLPFLTFPICPFLEVLLTVLPGFRGGLRDCYCYLGGEERGEDGPMDIEISDYVMGGCGGLGLVWLSGNHCKNPHFVSFNFIVFSVKFFTEQKQKTNMIKLS